MTDRQDSVGIKIDINRAFVCVFNGNTRPETLKYSICQYSNELFEKYGKQKLFEIIYDNQMNESKSVQNKIVTNLKIGPIV